MKQKKLNGRRVTAGICVAVVLFFGGLCSGMPLDGHDPANRYRVGAGDVLYISVWKNNALTQQVTVLPDGTFNFPLIGVIYAKGKTIQQLKAEIVKKISPYVPDPIMSIMVQQTVSYQVYIIGKVNRPGNYLLHNDLEVLQALAMAGGLNPFAKANGIKIFRNKGAEKEIFEFRYKDVVKGKHLKQNIRLKRGDVIVVP